MRSSHGNDQEQLICYPVTPLPRSPRFYSANEGAPSGHHYSRLPTLPSFHHGWLLLRFEFLFAHDFSALVSAMYEVHCSFSWIAPVSRPTLQKVSLSKLQRYTDNQESKHLSWRKLRSLIKQCCCVSTFIGPVLPLSTTCSMRRSAVSLPIIFQALFASRDIASGTIVADRWHRPSFPELLASVETWKKQFTSPLPSTSAVRSTISGAMQLSSLTLLR